MIRYSFLLLDHSSYFRFENWLALNFHIICFTEDELHSALFEQPFIGYFDVPKEIHEDFLAEWKKIKDEFRMKLVKKY